MSNIERIQKEGNRMLLSSGWDNKKIDALIECLIDFTSQAFYDEMYRMTKLSCTKISSDSQFVVKNLVEKFNNETKSANSYKKAAYLA